MTPGPWTFSRTPPRRATRALLAAALAGLLAACGGGGGASGERDAAGATTAPAPKVHCALPATGQMFPPVDPALLGFDPQKLQEAVDFGQRLLTTSIRIYRHGCLATESALDPVTAFVPQALASASKTVLSLSVGRAVTLGHLGLDDPIGRYLPEADAAHGAITVRQLLNQTSGLQLVLADEIAGLATDPVQQTLALPFWYEPGTEFMYAQNTLSVLARVVERATGVEFQQFTQRELMDRVGIPRDHWVWLRDRSGGTVAMGGLLLRPDDEARLGHLMLHRGRWGNEQVISASYLQQATTGTAANPGHGFLIWLNAGDTHKGTRIGRPLPIDRPLLPGTPRDAYGAMGAMGQMTVVVPSRNLVIVRNGGPGGGASTVEGVDYKEFVRLVVASIADQPQNTDPGPYSYPDGPSQFDPSEFDTHIADWQLIGTLLGVGAGTLSDCSVYWCNGRSPVDDVAKLGVDVVQQLLAAVTATAVDRARGPQPSEVTQP